MPVVDHDIEQFADYCAACLSLEQTEDAQYYQHLPLCVIDAVFSINAHYTSAQNAVVNFCAFADIPMLGPIALPPIEHQLSIGRFVASYSAFDDLYLAQTVFRNRQRTAPRGGILKAEAVIRYGKALAQANVLYLQDVGALIHNPQIEHAIRAIPGQGSGISFAYFKKLLRVPDAVKPDRMIHRFINAALKKKMTNEDAQDLVSETAKRLQVTYPHLTAARLDRIIWQYQRVPEPRIVERHPNVP